MPKKLHKILPESWKQHNFSNQHKITIKTNFEIFLLTLNDYTGLRTERSFQQRLEREHRLFHKRKINNNKNEETK